MAEKGGSIGLFICEYLFLIEKIVTFHLHHRLRPQLHPLYEK